MLYKNPNFFVTACLTISDGVSSVASFLVLGGGGGQDPEMYRQKIYVLILRERAPQKHIFSGLKYICIHIQSMHLPLITYGMAL